MWFYPLDVKIYRLGIDYNDVTYTLQDIKISSRYLKKSDTRIFSVRTFKITIQLRDIWGIADLKLKFFNPIGLFVIIEAFNGGSESVYAHSAPLCARLCVAWRIGTLQPQLAMSMYWILIMYLHAVYILYNAWRCLKYRCKI